MLYLGTVADLGPYRTRQRKLCLGPYRTRHRMLWLGQYWTRHRGRVAGRRRGYRSWASTSTWRT
eukprot:276675-Rhodomonas_salina.2